MKNESKNISLQDPPSGDTGAGSLCRGKVLQAFSVRQGETKMKDARMAIEAALNSLNLTKITLDMSRESLMMGHGIEGDVARDRIVELTLADQVDMVGKTIEGLQKAYDKMEAKAEAGQEGGE